MKINVVVPTGNFGNILAAYYAKCMGLPVHKSDLRVQQQQRADGFYPHRYVRPQAARSTPPFRRPWISWSPAIWNDCSYHLCRRRHRKAHGLDAAALAKLAAHTPWTQKLWPGFVRALFHAGCCGDEATVDRPSATRLKKTDYLCDTHTAVAVERLSSSMWRRPATRRRLPSWLPLPAPISSRPACSTRSAANNARAGSAFAEFEQLREAFRSHRRGRSPAQSRRWPEDARPL